MHSRDILVILMTMDVHVSRKTTVAAPVKTTAPNPMVQFQFNTSLSIKPDSSIIIGQNFSVWVALGRAA